MQEHHKELLKPENQAEDTDELSLLKLKSAKREFVRAFRKSYLQSLAQWQQEYQQYLKQGVVTSLLKRSIPNPAYRADVPLEEDLNNQYPDNQSEPDDSQIDTLFKSIDRFLGQPHLADDRRYSVFSTFFTNQNNILKLSYPILERQIAIAGKEIHDYINNVKPLDREFITHQLKELVKLTYELCEVGMRLKDLTDDDIINCRDAKISGCIVVEILINRKDYSGFIRNSFKPAIEKYQREYLTNVKLARKRGAPLELPQFLLKGELPPQLSSQLYEDAACLADAIANCGISDLPSIKEHYHAFRRLQSPCLSICTMFKKTIDEITAHLDDSSANTKIYDSYIELRAWDASLRNAMAFFPQDDIMTYLIEDAHRNVGQGVTKLVDYLNKPFRVILSDLTEKINDSSPMAILQSIDTLYPTQLSAIAAMDTDILLEPFVKQLLEDYSVNCSNTLSHLIKTRKMEVQRQHDALEKTISHSDTIEAIADFLRTTKVSLDTEEQWYLAIDKLCQTFPNQSSRDNFVGSFTAIQPPGKAAYFASITHNERDDLNNVTLAFLGRRTAIAHQIEQITAHLKIISGINNRIGVCPDEDVYKEYLALTDWTWHLKQGNKTTGIDDTVIIALFDQESEITIEAILKKLVVRLQKPLDAMQNEFDQLMTCSCTDFERKVKDAVEVQTTAYEVMGMATIAQQSLFVADIVNNYWAIFKEKLDLIMNKRTTLITEQDKTLKILDLTKTPIAVLEGKLKHSSIWS